jgi:hypothetical protein
MHGFLLSTHKPTYVVRDDANDDDVNDDGCDDVLNYDVSALL